MITRGLVEAAAPTAVAARRRRRALAARAQPRRRGRARRRRRVAASFEYERSSSKYSYELNELAKKHDVSSRPVSPMPTTCPVPLTPASKSGSACVAASLLCEIHFAL